MVGYNRIWQFIHFNGRLVGACCFAFRPSPSSLLPLSFFFLCLACAELVCESEAKYGYESSPITILSDAFERFDIDIDQEKLCGGGEKGEGYKSRVVVVVKGLLTGRSASPKRPTEAQEYIALMITTVFKK